MGELRSILERIAASGWDLTAVPARQRLDGNCEKRTLVSAIQQAERECGSCGPLYRRAPELL
ncbi:MAG: hypothetical protein Q4C45_10760 [Oscillospiraceae bacterium]|nr:hypothetical protein [Oscillospiraceae bacterium]